MEIHLSDWRFSKPFEEDDVSLFYGSFSLCAIIYKKRHKLPNKGNKGFLKGLCWNRPRTTVWRRMNIHTDITPQRRSDLLYSQKWNCAASFPISQDLSIYVFAAAKEMDQSLEYINRSQRHECRNLERGRAVSCLGIFVLNFQYSVFAVYHL